MSVSSLSNRSTRTLARHCGPAVRLRVGGAQRHGARPCALATPDAVIASFFEVARSSECSGDGVVPLLSDAALDAAIQYIKTSGAEGEAAEVTLDTCLVAALRGEGAPFFDSYAVRACKYGGIRSVEVMSVMSLSDTQQVQRHAVELDSGERMVLCFTVQLESTVRAAYKGISTDSLWVLASVSGEWEGDLPCSPHPAAGPEACLAAQLAALADADTAAVYAFASPANRAHTGPLERFSAMLESPVYRPLLSHLESEVLQIRHTAADAVVALVKIQSNPLKFAGGGGGDPRMFLWTIGRQRDGELRDCWLTDSVQAVPIAFLNVWPGER